MAESERAWQELLRAAARAAPVTAAEISGFEADFLEAPDAGESALSAMGSPTGTPPADLSALVPALRTVWPGLQMLPGLAHLDADEAWLLCRLLLLAPDLAAAAHGPLVVLLRRAVAAQDPRLCADAAAAVTALGVQEAQVEVAERLRQGPAALGHAAVEQLLTCLEATADGRAVRTLEAMLHERGAELGDAHAFRARRVIQVIRRAGRK